MAPDTNVCLRLKVLTWQTSELLSEFFLRQNLSLKLEAARLQLLQKEFAAMKSTLAEASSWVRDYFDIGSSKVSAFLEQLNSLQELDTGSQRPDISKSLSALRSYRQALLNSSGSSTTEEKSK